MGEGDRPAEVNHSLPGPTYLANVDALVIRLMYGDELPEQSTIQTIDAPPDEAPTLLVAYGDASLRISSVTIKDASRWVPPRVGRNSAAEPLMLQWASDRPDTLAVPLFPEAMQVGQAITPMGPEDHPAHVTLLRAKSGRVVALIIDRASERLDLAALGFDD